MSSGTGVTLGTTTVTQPAARADVAPGSESSSATHDEAATPNNAAARR